MLFFSALKYLEGMSTFSGRTEAGRASATRPCGKYRKCRLQRTAAGSQGARAKAAVHVFGLTLTIADGRRALRCFACATSPQYRRRARTRRLDANAHAV